MVDIAAGMNFRNRPLPVPANEAVGQPAATAADFIALLKPRVMSLVVFSGWAGLMVAPGSMHPVLAAIALMCIAVSAGAAGAVNMWYDRDIDAIMSRTQARPIPQGRVAPDAALAFGVILQAAAVVMMGLAVNWLAAGLLAFAAIFYVFVYTIWLKRRTPQNIVIGGAAGAFPPVIGWAAATGQVSWDAMALFALIFLWTPPHFWALALYRSDDYARAGVPMLPVVAGARTTKIQMVLYCILLLFVAPLPWLLGTAGLVYGITAITLSLVFLACAIAVFRRDDIMLQKRMFGFSILYLFALFAVLVVDRAPGIVAGF